MEEGVWRNVQLFTVFFPLFRIDILYEYCIYIYIFIRIFINLVGEIKSKYMNLKTT